MYIGISLYLLYIYMYIYIYLCLRPLPSNRNPYVLEDGDSITRIAAWLCCCQVKPMISGTGVSFSSFGFLFDFKKYVFNLWQTYYIASRYMSPFLGPFDSRSNGSVSRSSQFCLVSVSTLHVSMCPTFKENSQNKLNELNKFSKLKRKDKVKLRLN